MFRELRNELRMPVGGFELATGVICILGLTGIAIYDEALVLPMFLATQAICLLLYLVIRFAPVRFIVSIIPRFVLNRVIAKHQQRVKECQLRQKNST